MDAPSDTVTTFRDLALREELIRALTEVGYESPSPIQAATIPPLLAGRDLLGQAQTGTGKTAAFALPILQRIDTRKVKPQALVLAPTRELAIQVAEAFQRYAQHLPGFHVLPIYGGQSYGPQLGGLKRGVHVVVGTPGRIIDHLERGSLDLSELAVLVLDEADEMLRMGFIDDVEAVLKKTPPTRQIALFSATMPAPIKRIAQKYLRDPAEVQIKSKTTTAANIRQRYWNVSGMHKLDALTRILEVEPFDAMIVFTRTKQATEELAEKLQARGFSAAAINGDIVQAQRERTIGQLRDGKLDILVATDVAARGLDVERISHVINYDIPNDTEPYVHRIGRTGRAGRSGEAILFVTPREKGMLRAIERATRQPLEAMTLPSAADVNVKRVEKFKQRIAAALGGDGLDVFRNVIEQYEREHNVPAIEIAAALARLAQGDKPLLLDAAAKAKFDREFVPRDDAAAARGRASERGKREPYAPRTSRENFRRDDRATPFTPAAQRGDRSEGEAKSLAHEKPPRKPRDESRAPREGAGKRAPEPGMETYRVEVGHSHNVKPGNIVGAIANEAGLESKHIGRIEIYDDYSLIDLPEGMPAELLAHLKKVWVSGQRLRISRDDGVTTPGAARPRAHAGERAKGRPPGKKPHQRF